MEEKQAPIDGVQLMRDYYVMNSGEMNAVIQGLEKAVGGPLTAEDMEIESWLLHQAGKSVSAADYSDSLASWDRAAEIMSFFIRHMIFIFLQQLLLRRRKLES